MTIGEILEDTEHGIVQTIAQWWDPHTAAWHPGQIPEEDCIEDKLTPSSAADVYASLGRCDETLSRAARLVMLSQWCLETGGGHACHRYNIGNVKHVRGDRHRWTQFGCTEVIGGRVHRFEPPDPQTWFRAFLCLDHGVADYLSLLKHRFAAAWPAVLAGDVEAFGHALAVAHYYTADERAYVALLKRLRAELEKEIPADDAPEISTSELAGIPELTPAA